MENKNTGNKRAYKNENLAENSDKLGENASEEYKSEEYSNVLENKNKYKGMK